MGSKRNKKVKPESETVESEVTKGLNEIVNNNNGAPDVLNPPKGKKKRAAVEVEPTEPQLKKQKKGKQQKANKITNNDISIDSSINENIDHVNTKANIQATPKKKTKNKKLHETSIHSLHEENNIDEKSNVKSEESFLSPADKTPKKKSKRNKPQTKQADSVPDIIKVELITNQSIEDNQAAVVNGVTKSNDLIHPPDTDVIKKEIDWSEEDYNVLISRMERIIPEKDVLAYSTRAEKLNWNEIAFNKYTSEDCKQAWNHLQKHIRRFRLLREVLHDAKEWLKTPQAKKRTRRHPDMPRRPRSSYLLFFLKKKSFIQAENPGLDAHELAKVASALFKALPPEKKQKYEKQAELEREEFAIKIKEFYEQHPELKPQPVEKPRPVKEKPEKAPKSPKPSKPVKPVKVIETKPERPKTPFMYFFTDEWNKLENKQDTDKAAFRDQCREKWKDMSDKKKVLWINWAEKCEAEYSEQTKAYMQNHPDFVPLKKTVVSKEEKLLIERVAGKPVKPPNSAYSLFSRRYLLSDKVKQIDPRERMNYVSVEWKKLSEEERKKYQDEVVKSLAEYETAFNMYIQSLPEDKRKEEMEKAHPKRKLKPAEENEPQKKKAVKPRPRPKKKFEEPEQPPISAFKYFVKMYKGEDSPAAAWKALTAVERKKYEEELTEKKRQYIVNFEKFLKSLSKEELEEYSKARKEIKRNDDEEEDEEDDSSNSSSGSEVSDEDCDMSS